MTVPAFASAHAFEESWQQAAEHCLAHLSIPSAANLGFLYISDRLALHAEPILDTVREATGIPDWVGSIGAGICESRGAALDRSGISVLACRLPEGSFRVFSGRQPLTGGSVSPPHFAVVHADPGTPDMSDLILDMAGKVSSGFVTGGLTSSRGRALQIANAVVSGGISGAVFSEDVAIATRLTQGCTPTEPIHEITDAEGNLIYRIDGRPALEVFRQAVPESLREDLRRATQVVLAGLPIRGRDAGDFVVRHVVALDPRSGVIAINEPVERGQSLRWCRRDSSAAIQDMRRMLAAIREQADGRARGALYFSCLARGSNAFEADDTEVALIREALGEIPLAGFFCSGEISHDRLYAYTGVLTLFLASHSNAGDENG